MKRLKTRKYCFPQIWEQYFNVSWKWKGERFNTLLEPTLKIQLLWEIFNFYNPDRQSDEFSELYAPDLPLDMLRTKNKINGKWVKKRHIHFDWWLADKNISLKKSITFFEGRYQNSGKTDRRRILDLLLGVKIWHKFLQKIKVLPWSLNKIQKNMTSVECWPYFS